MRPRSRALVASLYGLCAKSPMPENPVEVAPGVDVPAYIADYATWGPREATRFLARMPAWLDVAGQSVLDVGCGAGALSLELARRGARRVLGIDTSREMIRFATAAAARERPELPVEFRASSGDPADVGDERFDMVFSKDAFEHYGTHSSAPAPETMAVRMMDRLHDGGLLVIGFGPLWKAPYGGHIDSWLPWAHLLFPEPVIMERYRRDRPPGKTAQTFEEGIGVNRMTLARFEALMARVGGERLHWQTNVGDRAAYKVLRVLTLVPALREHCTQNVYGVWRRPAGWRPPGEVADRRSPVRRAA